MCSSVEIDRQVVSEGAVTREIRWALSRYRAHAQVCDVSRIDARAQYTCCDLFSRRSECRSVLTQFVNQVAAVTVSLARAFSGP